ncbi:MULTISPECIES: hypothetical protein [unclassified Halorhabdus]|uniref:hypothetical protein n=1 Tax=unclassified Halorhabdus TaxID=2621901 RepID=UPI0023DBC76E|nr:MULTISPECIES: hypothetical protein [unclassified Halorhabdus]WEL18031.1 Uncharacterized protein SVXHr_1869 [Halorhabdus sp. SVX81]WEL21913.1 Uncharacterized protein HBNXHr_1857 [Halorhabdus sp. BNX81]
MLESLTPTCEADGCDQRLHRDDRQIVYESPGGTRHVYECSCGAVTVTVAR